MVMTDITRLFISLLIYIPLGGKKAKKSTAEIGNQ
jgi:hypothetical protein